MDHPFSFLLLLVHICKAATNRAGAYCPFAQCQEMSWGVSVKECCKLRDSDMIYIIWHESCIKYQHARS